MSEATINIQAVSTAGIHLMAKPAGPSCNLRCAYCFYLEKEALFNAPAAARRMSDEVLEAYIRQTAEADTNPEGILFSWQGGEPTLMGLDFFRKALALEKKYAGGRSFSNTLQTNGTLLDDSWCRFFAENNFLIGLSLDGPEHIHDLYRVDVTGKPTFKKVFQALKLLQKHNVQYNILACISRESSKSPLEIYRFFKESGVEFIQFTPIVERIADETAQRLGLKLGMPPDLKEKGSQEVTPWSVEPEAFGDFMIAIFDEWVRHDVGKVFVMNFEWAITNAMGGRGAVCTMSDQCGNACIVEADGSVYSCDHFVYPDFKLGNILTDDIKGLVNSERQRSWGARKQGSFAAECRECAVASVCRGGCPKHRFMESCDGKPVKNYLCAGYKKFYTHSAKYMKALWTLLELDQPPEYIMQAIDRPLVIPASAKTGNKEVVLWVK